MIRKITLSNFMAHEHSELILGDGLNVLVGPNNIGKSTVAVALKILARNANSNFVLQHDQKECSISVETSEGHVVQWIKRKSPSYKINGQTKDRLGRGGTPPELDETLRLAPIEFEDKDFEPHFGEQKSPIFLINRSPSQIAQFFSTTSDAERLVAMQRLHQKQRTDAQNQSKLLSEHNASLQEELTCLDSLPDLNQQLANLEQVHEMLLKESEDISKLDSLIRLYVEVTLEFQFELQQIATLSALQTAPVLHSLDYISKVVTDWESARETVDRSSEANQVLSPLDAPPRLDDTLGLHSAITAFTKWSQQDLLCSEQLSALGKLSTPPTLSSIDSLVDQIRSLTNLQSECDRLMLLAGHLRQLPAVPEFHSVEALAGTMQSYEVAISETLRHDQILAALNQLQRPIELPNWDSFRDLLQTLERSIAECKANEAAYCKVQTELQELDALANQWLKTEPVCNSCGAALTQDSVRFRLHRH